MRRALRLLLAIVFVLFAFSLAQSITTVVSLSRAVAATGESGVTRSGHVAVFLPEPTTLFFDEIRRGISTAAMRYDLAVSYHPIGPEVPEFRFAQYLGIDGAIIYPFLDDGPMLQRLEELDDRGIPVVLIEHDVADDWPWTFVGTNNFEMGRRIGGYLAEDAANQHVVVVYSDKSPAVDSESELLELGITSVIGDQLEAPIARRRTGLNPLDAEALTNQLLRGDTPVTSIVFTDNDDTLAALQVIIDRNLVGQVEVIGFGVTDAILDYLERGVLDATIAVNPQRIGVDAVRVLSELIATGIAPGYVDTGVEVIGGDDL